MVEPGPRAAGGAEAREAALRDLVAECVAGRAGAALRGTRRRALGPVPDSGDQLAATCGAWTRWRGRWRWPRRRTRKPSGSTANWATGWSAYRAKAAALGVSEGPDIATSYSMAAEALDRQPSRMVLARQLVTLYQTFTCSSEA